MKRLIPLIALVVLVVILAGASAPAVSDTRISLTDTSIPDNEITTSRTEASNSSASATITITMRGVVDKQFGLVKEIVGWARTGDGMG